MRLSDALIADLAAIAVLIKIDDRAKVLYLVVSTMIRE